MESPGQKRAREEALEADPDPCDNQYKCAKATAQQVLDTAIEYANDRGAKHAISRDTLFAQHVSVQMLSLKADWATSYDYTTEFTNIGNAIETLANAVDGFEMEHAFDGDDGTKIADGAQRVADAMATIANSLEHRPF